MCSTWRIGSLLMLIDVNPMTASCTVCVLCSDLYSYVFLQFDSKDLQCQDSPQCEPCRI